MRRIIHISDLHFGRENPLVLERLLAEIRSLHPDLVVISGDFTQRARSSQFRSARDFLHALPVPYLAVPGNHDLPLYHLARRVFHPLANYERYIHPNPEPEFADGELCILGVDTTNRFQWKEGRWRKRHLSRIRDKFSNDTQHLLRILVMHHPPHLGSSVLQDVLATEPDILLSGHLHLAGATLARPPRIRDGRSIILASAGTAISVRLRGESNSFNVIDVERPSGAKEKPIVRIESRIYSGNGFTRMKTQTFVHEKSGWTLRETEKELS